MMMFEKEIVAAIARAQFGEVIKRDYLDRYVLRFKPHIKLKQTITQEQDKDLISYLSA